MKTNLSKVFIMVVCIGMQDMGAMSVYFFLFVLLLPLLHKNINHKTLIIKTLHLKYF